MQRFFIVGGLSPTNVNLLEAVRDLDVDAALLPVEDVLDRATPGDIALARLDVLPTLDGVDPGLDLLVQLEDNGVHVLNRPAALAAAHDKLITAIRLREANLPHPRTSLVDEHPSPRLPLPAVIKPRFGSWGRDVFLCRDARALRGTLRRLRRRPWFLRQGALVQELVPPRGEDLRVIVAGGCAVGAVKRVAAPGEWRTNVALGARRVRTALPPEARALAVAAADALGGDLVGVDLLPTDGGYAIIEVNGCVELTPDYSLGATDVFEEIAVGLVASSDVARARTEAASAGAPPRV
jgi:RimK family alpha-L-glutamate ligase